MSTTLSRINSHDVGAKLVLAAALTLSYAVILLCTRLHTRWKGDLKAEDYILLLAVCLGIAYTVIVSWAVGQGLGQRVTVLSDEQKDRLSRSVIAANLLVWATEGAATSSYGVFLASLCAKRRYQQVMKYTNWATWIWTVAAVSVGSVFVGTETNFYAASIALGVPLAIIHLIFTISVISMILGSSIKRTRKITATAWFLFGICTAIVTILRLTYQPRAFFEGDWTFERIGSLIFLTVEMQLCVYSATYVTLLKFLSDSSTGHTIKIGYYEQDSDYRSSRFTTNNRSGRTGLQDTNILVSNAAECARAGSMELGVPSIENQVITVESSVTVTREW